MKRDFGGIITEAVASERFDFARHIKGQGVGGCDNSDLHGLLPFDELMIAWP